MLMNVFRNVIPPNEECNPTLVMITTRSGGKNVHSTEKKVSRKKAAQETVQYYFVMLQ